jgi:predicted SnoaL-like aldol condensation-catalyzing enzyme
MAQLRRSDNHDTRDNEMLDRRALLMSAASAAPALTTTKANAQSGACAPENVAANAALFDRYVAAVNAGDTAALQGLFAQPYIQHGGLKGGTRTVFPDLHVTVEDRIFAGDKIVARNTWSGTHRGTFLGIAPTGKQVTIRTIDIWRVDDGKLAEHWDVIDLGALEKQLRES